MILVDTSVWIDHFRRANRTLVEILDQGRVASHPLVVGELALGSIARRSEVLEYLGALPALGGVSHEELMSFIEGQALFGRGIGLVDAHLLAAARVASGTLLWTHDRRLSAVATELGLSARLS